MPFIAGENFETISSTKIRTTIRLQKEGCLLLFGYTKGNEDLVSIKINLYIDNLEITDINEYALTETDSDSNIILWERNLLDTIRTIYPVRLPGRCTKFDLIAEFIGGTTGILTADVKSHTFYFGA